MSAPTPATYERTPKGRYRCTDCLAVAYAATAVQHGARCPRRPRSRLRQILRWLP